jgi:hypothetical protein
MAGEVSAAPRIPLLDHIVILVPHEVVTSPPRWLTENLNIITGGRHTNGITENKLIILRDGVYIELIAFIEGIGDADRMQHRWGSCKDGHIVDWAYTLGDPTEFRTIQERVKEAGGEIFYHDPVEGGRVKPDGTEIKWSVADPSKRIVGQVPFWCFDITPRELRVPASDDRFTSHPCGATGVASMNLTISNKDVAESVRPVYDAIHSSTESGNAWSFGTPRGGHGQTRLKSESGPGFGISLGLWADVEVPTEITGHLGSEATIQIQLLPKF